MCRVATCLFLTLAAALAYRRGLEIIVTGVCETDYSGYPDCRDDSMKAMQLALSLGMDKRFLIETPLMWIDKADTPGGWREQLGGQPLVDLIVGTPTPATWATGLTGRPGAMATASARRAGQGGLSGLCRRGNFEGKN